MHTKEKTFLQMCGQKSESLFFFFSKIQQAVAGKVEVANLLSDVNL